jgi:hypothetical protein
MIRPAGKFRFPNMPDCPYEDEHTPSPQGYVEWFEWAEKMSEDHVQVKCKGCKRYVIWIPKSSHVLPTGSSTTDG